MKLILFHDEEARRWTPFVETRPLGELLYGALLLRERAERALGLEAVGYAGASHLAGFDEPGTPPHIEAAGAAADEDRLFLCVRAALEPLANPLEPRAATLLIGDQVAGWIVPAEEAAPSAEELLRPRAGTGAGERLSLAGELLGRPWHLMAGNAPRLKADVAAEPGGSDAFQLTGVHVLGHHRVLLADGALVEPGVVLDARSGPVWLDHEARIEGPARVVGPLYLGPGSAVLGGSVGSTSIGPRCRVRGEVADSVIVGYCNKAHDGHLSHAVVGRWVNLGAGTTNSDLKNTYASVRVALPDGEVDTGQLKVGCFLGDHVRTGIGVLLNTGTVVGAGSNLFGGRMAPRYLPPFSWGEGENLVTYQLDRFLATAQVAMRRRDVELSDGMREVLRRAWERGQTERAQGASGT